MNERNQQTKTMEEIKKGNVLRNKKKLTEDKKANE